MSRQAAHAVTSGFERVKQAPADIARCARQQNQFRIISQERNLNPNWEAELYFRASSRALNLRAGALRPQGRKRCKQFQENKTNSSVVSWKFVEYPGGLQGLKPLDLQQLIVGAKAPTP